MNILKSHFHKGKANNNNSGVDWAEIAFKVSESLWVFFSLSKLSARSKLVKLQGSLHCPSVDPKYPLSRLFKCSKTTWSGRKTKWLRDFSLSIFAFKIFFTRIKFYRNSSATLLPHFSLAFSIALIFNYWKVIFSISGRLLNLVCSASSEGRVWAWEDKSSFLAASVWNDFWRPSPPSSSRPRSYRRPRCARLDPSQTPIKDRTTSHGEGIETSFFYSPRQLLFRRINNLKYDFFSVCAVRVVVVSFFFWPTSAKKRLVASSQRNRGKKLTSRSYDLRALNDIPSLSLNCKFFSSRSFHQWRAKLAL